MRAIAGFSLLGVLFWGAIAGIAIILAMRVVPFYTEFAAIKRALVAAAAEGEPQAIRQAFDRRASADYITSVSARDLEIRKDGEHGYVVRVAYEKVLPLVANVSLLFTFEASAP
ncbi:MAG: DUF4845 domain-containing protein [Hydrogenophilus sp.]|nr:DUF4845 domain-containing protein [Hydrogenophilus thermoluteolus]